MISYDISEDNEGLQIVNDMPNAELIYLRKKCTELRRGYEGLLVTTNAAEEELISPEERWYGAEGGQRRPVYISL